MVKRVGNETSADIGIDVCNPVLLRLDSKDCYRQLSPHLLLFSFSPFLLVFLCDPSVSLCLCGELLPFSHLPNPRPAQRRPNQQSRRLRRFLPITPRIKRQVQRIHIIRRTPQPLLRVRFGFHDPPALRVYFPCRRHRLRSQQIARFFVQARQVQASLPRAVNGFKPQFAALVGKRGSVVGAMTAVDGLKVVTLRQIHNRALHIVYANDSAARVFAGKRKAAAELL